MGFLVNRISARIAQFRKNLVSLAKNFHDFFFQREQDGSALLDFHRKAKQDNFKSEFIIPASFIQKCTPISRWLNIRLLLIGFHVPIPYREFYQLQGRVSMTYQFAEINGVKYHYDLQGEGETLVLIHSGIANLQMWEEQLDEFCKQFQILRYDARGWGETPDPAGTNTDHDDLKELLKVLDIDRTHVLGLSYGGQIAIDFALAYPEMVINLIAVAPALGGFDFPKDAYIDSHLEKVKEATRVGDLDLASEIYARMWVDGPFRKAEEVDQDVRERAIVMIKHSLALVPECLGDGSILDPPAATRLGEIQAKTLLIFGDKDADKMKAVADSILANVPGVTFAEIKDVGHSPNMEKPERFNQIVLDFLLE